MQPKDFVTKFIKSGFSVYDLNPQYEKPVTITLEEILKKYTIKNEDSTYLIFVKGKTIL